MNILWGFYHYNIVNYVGSLEKSLNWINQKFKLNQYALIKK